MHRNLFQRHLWSLLLSGWLVSACTAPENKPPENLISEAKMADILTEVHMAEARISRINLRSVDSSQIVYKRLENQIFKKFGVDTATYRKSYIFYSSHPADMEAIYKQVTEELQKKTKIKTKKPL
ncbi:DUF4296 domain-containing protein [Spirosoma radiotolerans]|uniref:DUF4296 domain-containing protein n=1 Tax=Spirosoma radiotolerans TaxID=1379870 RepID=A0A0E3V4Y3_9BACT|nr:DUF4296 domain-containing protein [Spirosoma radiotolerans]AKD53717.1 hypothetical protein SD10_01175 [Spirosoma radiotolerans]